MHNTEKLVDALENACRNLPADYEIVIEIDDETITVNLENPDGDNINFPSNLESTYQEVRDAVEWAVALESP